MNENNFNTGSIVNTPQLALIGSVNNPQNEYIIRPDIIKMLSTGRIGIGITTHNRPDRFSKALSAIINLMPTGAVVAIVDDASTNEYMLCECMDRNNEFPSPLLYRFESNVGIARAKNKCLEMLYDAGCDHLFLFDDDTFPLVKNWWVDYVENAEPHLMYIFKDFTSGKSPNDMIELYRDNSIVAYSHVRGCMLYYKRICLDTVGGMDVAFGRWGHEHGDLSNRIYSSGLTRFRYMDIPNSKGLFYSADEQEHGKFPSTVPGAQRIEMLAKSKALYDSHYNTPVFCKFKEDGLWSKDGKPHFLSTYFTTLPDPQREGQKWKFDISATDIYSDSIYRICSHYARTVILYDDPMPNNLALGSAPTYKRVSTSINPYFQRWVSYYDYLIKHREEISWVFMTDCTDVELLKWPEPQHGIIYVGGEPQMIAQSQWLQYHHKHPDLIRFYQVHGRKRMANAGVMGGYIDDVLPFVRAIIDTYSRMTHDQNVRGMSGPGMTDMGIFNYVAFHLFNSKISMGNHVTTTFKANERNEVSWFRHK